MKHSITIEIDTDSLRNLTDSALAQCWHVAQANPADDADDPEAGRLVEDIGREIIRRWLGSTGPELWEHQGSTYYWAQLAKHGSWPGPDHKTWLYEPGKAEREEANLVDAEVRHG